MAASYHVQVSKILHSGKKRAQQTAEIFDRRLSPPDGMQARSGMNPLDDVRAFGQEIRLDQQVMLVGHLPFLQRLIGMLLCGNPEQLVFKLQNSGIVCLDQVPEVKNPVIRWALMPTVG